VISDFQNEFSGSYRYVQTNAWLPDLTLVSEPLFISTTQIPDPLKDSTITFNIPAEVKVSREGRLPAAPIERQFLLSTLSVNDSKEVFQAPPCLDGEYYAGFQLYYDLGDQPDTKPDWAAYLQISLFHGEDSLWTKPLRVDITGQTFIATAFYENLISCDESYYIVINQKQIEGSAPQDNIYLKFLLYKKSDAVFNPAAEVLLNCANTDPDLTNISWNFSGEGAIEYDLEWVFIADHENFLGTTPLQAFQFKEPVGITTGALYFNYLSFYPDGRLWHRVRAVGYNPEYPDHRIPGHWFYLPCESIRVLNKEPDKNWQIQTVFAEEGKYKKVVHYFDGSLRERQVQTNLNTNAVTMIGETMYDFEGRKSVDILPVSDSEQSQALTFRNSFNNFEALNDTVDAKTSSARKKFNYDNHRLENSVLANNEGAGWYYSSANNYLDIHNAYIPNSEGYAFSQTEYLRDGTGRVSRQSGVGKEFGQDGDHATRYVYGTVAPEELIRLFGSNVGKASHYKKNLVVDPNGQVSLSYHDQEDRVIATALAGNKPDNVAALDSYTALANTPVTVNISNRNERIDRVSSTGHKILNAVPNTNYTFRYDLSSYASQVEQIGCEACQFDLRITITDPDGTLINLSTAAGNQSVDGLSYERRDISAASCVDPTLVNVQFDVFFSDIGDYTITKTLIPHELSFADMQELVSQNTTVQSKTEAIRNSYSVDPSECEICTSGCPEEEEIINEAINEIATLDCENILNTIEQKLRDQYPDSLDFEPLQAAIEADSLYCKYLLCSKNKPSDVFEKHIARIINWDGAVTAGYGSPVNMVNTLDPFFANAELSGYNAKSTMNGFLNDIFLASANSVDYRGPILQVTDPNNTDYYIDNSGNQNSNGKHILYLDLMNRRTELGETAYQAQLKEQRWSYYKGFYLEAKRKTKLAIGEYQNCPKAKAELEMPDNLPTTEEEIISFGVANGVGGPISKEEVEMSYHSIKHTCDAVITPADSTTIGNHLEAYFNGNRKNFFNLIFRHQVNVDEHLVAIQSILTSYGCGLDTVAEDDPLTCSNDTTVVIDGNFLVGSGDEELLTSSDESAQRFATDENGKRMGVEQKLEGTDSTVAKKGWEQDPQQIRRREEMLEKIRKTVNDRRALRQKIRADKIENPSNSFVKAEEGDTVRGKAQLSKESLTGTAQPREKFEGKGGDSSDIEDNFIKAKEKELRESLNAKIQKERDDKYALRVRTYFNELNKDTSNKKGAVNQVARVNAVCEPDLQAEHEALMALFNATTGSGWFDNTGWGQPYPTNVNDWRGIETDALGHVIMINLSSNNLIGTLPQEITDLCLLKSLNLAGNQLTGGLPSDIDKLQQLEQLQLSYNQLSVDLPEEITNLENLKFLDLTYNQITGTIPSSIGNLTQLEYLSLGWNQLTGNIPESIGALSNLVDLNLNTNLLIGSLPSSIGNLNALESLQIGATTLSGQIPASIGNLSNLTNLNLSSSNLTGEIPVEIGTLGQLRYLSLSNNQLNGSIPTIIGSLLNLVDLDLSINQFSGSIPESITTLPTLMSISLGGNNLTGTIPASLGNLSTLYSFNVGFNQLSGPIPPELMNLPNLQSFFVNNNNLTGSIPEEIGNLTDPSYLFVALNDNQLSGSVPSTIWNSGITYLIIGDNNLSGNIPANIGSHVQLFSFFNNDFTFSNFLQVKQNFVGSESNFIYSPQAIVDDVKEFNPSEGSPLALTTAIDRTTTPSCLYQWFKNNEPVTAVSSESHTLTISNVSPSDAGNYYYTIINPDAPDLLLISRIQTVTVGAPPCQSTPAEEYNALIALYYSTNGDEWNNNTGWTEAFPADVGNWYGVNTDAEGHVTSINLEYNNLVGEIYPFPDLCRLDSLNLTGASQTGAIPSWIESLGNLTYLNLGGNQYSGTIPGFLSSMTQLKHLELNGNQLNGGIPIALANLTDLRYLSLALNPLGGSIPPELGQLDNLTDLILFENQLSGSIPATFGDMGSLEVLNLQGNQLTGSIPSTLANLSQLNILDVSLNQLTGSIPPQLGSLTNLQILDAYGNQLSGTLPVELGDLSSLVIMQLTANRLTGNIPVEFGNLSQLQILNLGYNLLTGPIPSELGGLSQLTALILSYNKLNGSIPTSLGNLSQLTYLDVYDNLLSGPIPSQLGNLNQLYYLNLSYNQLSGEIPASLGNLSQLSYLYLYTNQLTGSIPPELGNLSQLTNLYLAINQLTGTIPVELHQLSNLRELGLYNNQLTGGIPSEFSNLTSLKWLQLGNNNLSGSIPLEVASIPGIERFYIDHNKYTFTDILPIAQNTNILYIFYHAQDSVDLRTTQELVAGQPITFTATVDRTTNPPCKYQWFKFVDGVNDIPVTSQEFGNHTFTIASPSSADVGKYYYKITNDDPTLEEGFAELIVVSRFQEITGQTGVEREICLEYDPNNPTLQKFTFTVNWNQLVQQCLENAAKEDSILVDFAIEKMIEEEVTTFYNSYSTKCFEGATEVLRYSYIPKEYHYTLYYFDQAGNLTQTVPPQGVKPLSDPQVIAFTAGNKTEPPHTMLTQYKYNASNQLIWQKTPDAGESQFWYNEKSQLRLSQNAQQLKDSTYSYTRYDEQGRIAEVGELLNGQLTYMVDSLESLSFPNQNDYLLADITRTHYDFAKPGLSDEFTQQFLRNRVAYVEVLEKNQPDTIATYYTYDIHGNVKSLLQQLPGLQVKRTDYVYDLISGKVNYVMYEYGKKDQLIHRYAYDADNRSIDVFTSTDGFIWDKEANYAYYLHGPLARTELGEYRLQGLDHYYTLQGWIKGVNSYFLDPGVDGSGDSAVPLDEFSYNLGYFKDDYTAKGIPLSNNVAFHFGTLDYQGLYGNTGLYNGNISWMATDLKKIGEMKGNREEGLQGMLYQYDQLHRIRQSRSLIVSEGARGAAPMAYDEDYTYDANGNILTLQRRDHQAALKDNFTYGYYTGTNKLRQLIPVERDTVYNGGAITSNQKVYRNITIQGTSYVQPGADVILKATENIDISDNFDVADDANFHAYVLPDEEGVFLYDAIGNLIWDQEEGVKISWNPYGKVRQVVKGDTTTISFRYDGSGNRVEKKIVRPDKTIITRYVRDAGGNVMTVYNDSILSEQPIYGSSRVGLYRGGRTEGHRTLGYKNYEMSNHLGNVMVVISDKKLWKDNAVVYENNFASSKMPFESDGTIVMSLDSGRLKASGASQSNSVSMRIKTEAGTQYRVSFDIDVTSGGIITAIANDANTHQNLESLDLTDNGSYSYEFTATGNATLVLFSNSVAGPRDFYIDSVVIMNLALDTGYKLAADVISTNDYYPFGLAMEGRNFSNASYRYGFNGKEKEDGGEFGETHYDYGFRIYNPTIGRFLSVDPLTQSYPELTPFQYASNSPIMNIDLDGLEGVKSIDNESKKVTVTVTVNYVEKDKGMSKQDKSRSFTASEIEKLKKGSTTEFNKKGVPQHAMVSQGQIVTNFSQDDEVPEMYEIEWKINFVKHNTWASAEASSDPNNTDVFNTNMLLTKITEQTSTIPNPNYNSSLPESSSNSPQLQMRVPGSSEWRRLNLTSATNSHNAVHELFHNFIHNHANNSNSTSPAYRRSINTFQGHSNSGGIFIRQDARTGTKLQNINHQNVNEVMLTLPSLISH
jgi:RHS repeat-associated protein